jgi:hypothetical protein
MHENGKNVLRRMSGESRAAAISQNFFVFRRTMALCYTNEPGENEPLFVMAGLVPAMTNWPKV